MPTFALITEGITDQVVLEIIIQTVYEHLEDGVDCRPIQPARDATDSSRQEDLGGWERVLEFCTFSKPMQEILDLNDYVVIQIDTDCCEHVNFGVSLAPGGVERSPKELVDQVVEAIIAKLTPEIYEANQHKIIFAVAIHSLECWLLPLHAKKAHDKTHTKKCEARLRHVLYDNGDKYAKEHDVYEELAKPYQKLRIIHASAKLNDSFAIFLDSLPTLVDAPAL